MADRWPHAQGGRDPRGRDPGPPPPHRRVFRVPPRSAEEGARARGAEVGRVVERRRAATVRAARRRAQSAYGATAGATSTGIVAARRTPAAPPSTAVTSATSCATPAPSRTLLVDAVASARSCAVSVV